ncbi:MAG: GTP-binding protein [Candidatus Colwellbacteria bacterium]|nr:GTP-binding protein [Candidatus Colwellbacteria bacterium]
MADENEKKLLPRPPIVAVVGHVDHGKTTLLDYIRKTNLVSREAGGITQSIGAYEVEHPSTDSGQVHKITFIDTPGHEAFSTMRVRGATAADLAVLVVAADEGVKPQTTEAITILRETKTPFVVAITKIDKSTADINKVKNELTAAEVFLEGMGGQVSWHGVSGTTGEGVDELLDLLVLAGEVADLKYDPEAKANGFVIETKKESRRGIVAHLVLKDGCLREGDEIVTPSSPGKVKILEDFLGKRLKKAYPSAPLTVIGFEDLPKSGEEFWAGKVDVAVLEKVEGELPAVAPAAEAMVGEAGLPKAILKADTAGSLEALDQLLAEKLQVLAASVGEITDSDVKFAKATESFIIGFKTLANQAARNLADSQKVKILTSDIIYKLLEEVEDLLKAGGEAVTGGKLEVLAIFSKGKTKQTIGGRVVEGVLRVGNNVQIERGEEVLGRGRITNLQLNKVDVKEVGEGNECGLIISTSVEIAVGDFIKS